MSLEPAVELRIDGAVPFFVLVQGNCLTNKLDDKLLRLQEPISSEHKATGTASATTQL